MSGQPTTKIMTYTGSAADALAHFREESRELAEEGYYPISQCWMPGEYSYGMVVIAMLLCLITIGVILVIWMLLTKPAGTLVVTYQFSPNAVDSSNAAPFEEILEGQ